MMKWYGWTLVGIGIWILISPWALGFSALNLALGNNVLAGIAVIILAFWVIAPPRDGV
ncbi:MAG: SPW repeat protein [Candidatus Jorgensenbacteria bacterium]